MQRLSLPSTYILAQASLCQDLAIACASFVFVTGDRDGPIFGRSIADKHARKARVSYHAAVAGSATRSALESLVWRHATVSTVSDEELVAPF